MGLKILQLKLKPKLKRFGDEFLANLKNNPSFIHIFWGILSAVIITSVIFIYQQQLTKRDKIDFNRKDMAAKQSSQYFDDRAEEYNGDKIWQEIKGSPFAQFAEAGLLDGKVVKDSLSGLVWSSRSVKLLTNEFTADKDKGVNGGEALAFCENLNKIKYAGYGAWQLPAQKQLMQSYIDGASQGLENINYVWSATEFLGDADRAWMVNLSAGDTASNRKNNSSGAYAVCVATE